MTSATINDAVTMQGGAQGALLANRYRVVRQLGQGGMGSVWLAEDTQLDNKQFAIKMLPSILVSNKRAYRQLKDEALVAMQLVHPNIVQIRAFEENNGNPFLVMDYIDGQTLDDYLAEYDSRVEHVERVEGDVGRDARPARPSGGLPEDEVVRILKPIAAALDYAHSKGVVHRDVKPGNVMIAKDGTPYILDFGIAREIQETMTRVTGKLSSGTLLYMSPEQLRGLPPKKEQDIYSFAAMAYECLKGEPPFSRGQIEYQILNEQPEPLDPNFTKSGSVMQGLAKKAEDRPKTCAAVLEGRVSTQRRRDAEGASEWRGDRIEPAGGARSSRPSSGNERKGGGVGRALVAAALFVAIGGGVWWWMKEGTKGSTESNDAEEWAKTAATEICIEAKVLQAKVERISDSDGFRSRKADLAVQFSRADALFDESVKRWSDAAQGFSNYVANAQKLIILDGERNVAVAKRTEAEAARRGVLEANADKHATVRWNEAVRLMSDAAAKFGVMSFKGAGVQYGMAKAQFDQSIVEANEEETNQKSAAAKIRKEAGSLQAKVERISDTDGFRTRKAELAVQFSRADALFNESVKRWSDAAQGFSDYVANARKLIILDGERNVAVAKRTEAEAARKDALKANADKHATVRWNEAVRLMSDSDAKFGVMSFKDAQVQYGMAKVQFNLSIREANGKHRTTTGQPGNHPPGPIGRKYKFEAVISSYVIDRGYKKYVTATPDPIPGFNVRVVQYRDKPRIVLGTDDRPTCFTRLHLNYEGHSGKKWIEPNMFNGQEIEVELK